MRKIFTIELSEQVQNRDAQRCLFISIVAAKNIHGESALRKGLKWSFDEAERIYFLSVKSEAGLHTSKMFAGFLTDLFGKEALKNHELDIDKEFEKYDKKYGYLS